MFAISICTVAQDKIIKKNNETISCKIVEIGIEEIKYEDPELSDGPVISILISNVKKVVLSSGRIIEFKDPLTDPESYIEDKKRALKIHFLSPLVEHLSFSYEKSLKPGRSLETGLGLIGVGFDTDPQVKSRGLRLEAGYKFMRTPDFYQAKNKYSHILKGSYVKPQVLISAYNITQQDAFLSGQSIDEDVLSFAFVINLGKQIIYDNAFLIDYSVGLGYGYSSQKEYLDDFYQGWRPNQYGFLVGDKNSPIALTGTLKIGWLLK